MVEIGPKTKREVKHLNRLCDQILHRHFLEPSKTIDCQINLAFYLFLIYRGRAGLWSSHEMATSHFILNAIECKKGRIKNAGPIGLIRFWFKSNKKLRGWD